MEKTLYRTNQQRTAQVGTPLKAQKNFLNVQKDTFVKFHQFYSAKNTRVDTLKTRKPLRQLETTKPILPHRKPRSISNCYGEVRVLFSARQISRSSPQLAQFRRSWSSGKMLAFQPRGFVFEPVRMREIFLQAFRSRRFPFFLAQ